MSPVMTFRIAFKALGRNKMRTGLTMLGMIIGVAAVITLVAMGNRNLFTGRQHDIYPLCARCSNVGHTPPLGWHSCES